MKLTELTFKPILTKEFDFYNKKVILKALNTKDTMEMDYDLASLAESDKFKLQDVLKTAVAILSRSIISIDGITPESIEETKNFLLTQEQVVVLDLLNKYQSMFEEAKVEVKN